VFCGKCYNLKQECTNIWRQIVVAPDTCGSSVWNLPVVTVLCSTFLRCLGGLCEFVNLAEGPQILDGFLLNIVDRAS
jgi:hypothetical protein